MMRYRIRHATRFDYATPVRFARCNLRLKPIIWSGQTLVDYRLTAEPGGTLTNARADASLANVTRLVIASAVPSLEIVSTATVDVDRVVPLPAPGDATLAEVAAAARRDRNAGAAGPANYLFPSPLIAFDRDIAAYCDPDLAPGRGVLDAAIGLARRIERDFTYAPGTTAADTTPTQAFALKTGVCQDFTQVMIAGLRAAGIPAAYVSGYLRTLPPPGQPRLVGADASHAWVLVWAGPARGWVGVDPTNGIWMASDHVVTAIGRDYSEVAPIDGVFLGVGARSLHVSVDVEPLHEAAPAHN